MDAKEFVANWKAEKDSYLTTVKSGSTLASMQVADMKLSEFQADQLWQLLDTVVTDVMYTLLLGLDGCAQIGGDQQAYEIRDKAGNIVSPCGDIEAEAYEQFQASI
jgi:hypothetical protein